MRRFYTRGSKTRAQIEAMGARDLVPLCSDCGGAVRYVQTDDDCWQPTCLCILRREAEREAT
jgi:hypothetical protein